MNRATIIDAKTVKRKNIKGGDAKLIEKKSTICWHCIHANMSEGSECSWMRNLTPVEGWKATPTLQNCGFTHSSRTKMRVENSFNVRKCPLYQKG